MTDPLAAILAIPPALDACKNLVSSLIAQLSRDNERQDARKIEAKIGEIAALIVRFTDFTETLRRWKEIHNVTQAILYQDLVETLAFLPKGPTGFADSVSSNTSSVQREFLQLTRGPRGAFMLVATLGPSDFVVDGMPESIDLSGMNWGQYLKNIGTRAEAAFTKREFGSLFILIDQLQTDCMVLNVRADARLKEGLGDITRIMHEVRQKVTGADGSRAL